MVSASDHSPTPSIDSAEEALFEMLGIDGKLGFDVEEEDELRTNDGKGENDIAEFIEPPRNCHRPHTGHTPLLVRTEPLIAPSKCEYIVQLGHRASNDGGTTFGPKYITAAAHSDGGAVVQLRDPNHHKVCVFQSDIVLQWIQNDVFRKPLVDRLLREWCERNKLPHKEYRINPRLRLLRYDARDTDVFLPHYDATTTMQEFDERYYESKLTILLYLNSGDGVCFNGGRTLFLNALEDCSSSSSTRSNKRIEVTPTRGGLVIFNHELYHSSEALIVSRDIVVPNYNNETGLRASDVDGEDGMVEGGTKFVLRSDVMFPVQQQLLLPLPEKEDTAHDDNGSSSTTAPHGQILVDEPRPLSNVTVGEIAESLVLDFDSDDRDYKESDKLTTTTTTKIAQKQGILLMEILTRQLEMYHLPAKTFLVPGSERMEEMLIDLGLQRSVAKILVLECERAVV